MVTKSWICDSCGEEITNVKDGWVEWLSRRENDAWLCRGLRLVHHRPASPIGRCQYGRIKEREVDGFRVYDLPLASFLGPDGLVFLLSYLAEGWHPKEEVLEMIKRLHIPGYERARLHFESAIADDVFEPDWYPGYYSQRDIEKTINWSRGRQPQRLG